MATSAEAVAELENLLGQMAASKGNVSGRLITAITKLCVNNVEFESVLIQKMYSHFKKLPSSHKLGALYAIDSVARRWHDLAKTNHQSLDGAASDGTPADAVNKVTELLPGLMDTMVEITPSERKEKLEKLVDIWQRVGLLPPSVISDLYQKIKEAKPGGSFTTSTKSTTPVDSPPRDVELPGLGPTNNGAEPKQDVSKILAALSQVGRATGASTATSAPPVASPQPPVTSQNTSSLALALSQLAAASQPSKKEPNISVYPTQHQQNSTSAVMRHTASLAPPLPPPMAFATTTAAPNVSGTIASPVGHLPHKIQAGAIRSSLPPPAPAHTTSAYPNTIPSSNILSMNANQNSQAQIILIKALMDQGISHDKIPGIMASIAGAGGSSTSAPIPAPTPASQSVPYSSYSQLESEHGHDRDRGRYDLSHSHNPGGSLSHSRSQRGRSRSRSPRRGQWGDHNNPISPHAKDINGRFGDFIRRHETEGRDYRQRSPQRRGRSLSPRGKGNLGPTLGIGPVGISIPAPTQVPKHIDFDSTLPPGSIKVYSRTLFVGGVTCTEPELTKIFSNYGYVQSCIVNIDKRHAFVKMVTRSHAEAAKTNLEDSNSREGLARPGHPFRQIRWGVGYGPRDCSDYSNGISIIPIQRLTDADRRWMLTAEYGGSGGQEIQQGLVVEEPDIEIGAGVSSKAISKRVGGEKGGHTQQKKGTKYERKGNKYDEHSNRGNNNWSHGTHSRGNGSRDIGNPNNMPVAERRTGGRSSHGHDEDVQPEVEGLPFGLKIGPNGFPQFPPGFTFPDPHSA